MIYLDNPHVILSWDEKLECVVAEWKGTAGDPLMKEVLDKALVLVQERHAHKWLADTRAIKPFGKEMQRWINEDWWPRSVEAGLQYMAFVLPTSAMARLAIQTAAPNAPDTIQTARFDNIEAAKAWLRPLPVRK